MLDWYSKHGHLQTLGCHLHLPKHGLKGKRWQTLPLHARGKLCKRPGFGCKVVFSSFFTVAPALFMQKQITHDDIVPLVLNHGNNEVLDVPVMSPHHSTASCTGRRRPLHLQKPHAHRPKCHLTHYHYRSDKLLPLQAMIVTGTRRKPTKSSAAANLCSQLAKDGDDSM